MSVTAYKVGNFGAVDTQADEVDPRGLLWVWEQPDPKFEYIVSVDPTMGISGWNRSIRTKDDINTDNAAIEVFRKPGIQVAEFAAPIDVYDLAGICNFIGKQYCGNSEEGQALMGIEVYPGPGWQVQQELLQRYGYTQFPLWLVVGQGLAQKNTHRFGWVSTRNSRIDLWTRCTALLNRHGAVLQSPWLIDEMADCTPDSFYAATGRARRGLHDDRVVATMMNVWWQNEWSLDIEPTAPDMRESVTSRNYQAMAIDDDGLPMTTQRLMDDWNEMADRLLDD